MPIEIVELRQRYAHYTYTQLANECVAILHFPYQASYMSLFEQYAMGVPLLFPSLDFLWTLHNTFDIVTERTWDRILKGRRPGGSALPAHVSHSWERFAGARVASASTSSEAIITLDPNNDLDERSWKTWMATADFYVWPHIITYDTWVELARLLADGGVDWGAVSERMLAEHKRMLQDTAAKWRDVIWAGGSNALPKSKKNTVHTRKKKV